MRFLKKVLAQSIGAAELGKIITELYDESSDEVTLSSYSDYSGRGMFGEVCYGLVLRGHAKPAFDFLDKKGELQTDNG